MNEIIIEAIKKIQYLSQNVEDGKHIMTGDIRKLSSTLYRSFLYNSNIGNSKKEG